MKNLGLFLMLFLGACSVNNNTLWRDIVGGRTLYEYSTTSGNLTGTRTVFGSFSTDAQRFVVEGGIFVRKSNSANSGLYESENNSSIKIQFDDMSTSGGKVSIHGGPADGTALDVIF